MTKFPLPTPAEPVLTQFNKIVDPILELIPNLVLQNRNLRATRDLILPKLISGEIPVEAAGDFAAQAMEQPA